MFSMSGSQSHIDPDCSHATGKRFAEGPGQV